MFQVSRRFTFREVPPKVRRIIVYRVTGLTRSILGALHRVLFSPQFCSNTSRYVNYTHPIALTRFSSPPVLSLSHSGVVLSCFPPPACWHGWGKRKIFFFLAEQLCQRVHSVGLGWVGTNNGRDHTWASCAGRPGRDGARTGQPPES